MKVQLNEQEIKAYINEAMRLEMNEALGKAGGTVAGKVAKKTASKAPVMIGHFPRGPKVTGHIKDAKTARKFIMGLKKGRTIGGTIENAKGTPKPNWFTKDGVNFFSDANCTKKLPKSLANGAKASFDQHKLEATRLFASAQRNMVGTLGVAGAGLGGYALGHSGKGNNPDPDAPWNDVDPQEPTAPDNGGFPWDDTEPRWTPRAPRRTAPQPEQQPVQPTQPEQPQRQQMEPIQPVAAPATMPTSVTGPQGGIQMRQPNTSLLGSASQAMVNAASTSPAVASQREQNRAINQTYRNARNAMKRDDYGPTAKQDMQTLRNVKNAVKRGDQHPSLEEGKLKLSEAQLNAYLNEAINEELDEIFGWSRSEQNAKWGYNWDKNLSAKQNRRNRAVNKAQIKAAGYRNAQEYEAGEGHAYGTQQQEPVYQPGQQSQPVNFEAGYPAPFANEKYKVGQFQTWFNQNMGGKLVVDGIWGKYTQAAWDQWLNSQGQGQELPAMSN